MSMVSGEKGKAGEEGRFGQGIGRVWAKRFLVTHRLEVLDASAVQYGGSHTSLPSRSLPPRGLCVYCTSVGA